MTKHAVGRKKSQQFGKKIEEKYVSLPSFLDWHLLLMIHQSFQLSAQIPAQSDLCPEMNVFISKVVENRGNTQCSKMHSKHL